MMTPDDLAKYQEKSITPVDHYVCSLSEASKKRAFEELNETEVLRQNSIKEIRDWMLNNKRIEKARFDSRFILRFLRRQGYNMKCTKEAIERFLIFREGRYDKGDWLSNLDCNRPNLKELLKAGVLVVLPNSTDKGERVVISKFSACKNYLQSHGKNENPILTALCMGSQIFEILWEDEENQVNGFHYIFDVSGVSLRQYFMLPFSTWFKICKNCERTNSSRNRGCHVVNMPMAVSFVAHLTLKHAQEKTRKTIKTYSSIDELEFISKDELPIEFGGTAPLQPIIDEWQKKLDAYRPFLMNFKNMKINEEFYKQEVLSCETKTLSHRLENRKANYLTEYDDEFESLDETI